MSDPLDRLYAAVIAAKSADPATSRTAKLLRAGRGKMAKKLVEEAAEVVIDAISGQNESVVKESADLLYNLTVLWVATGIQPKDVSAEMARREPPVRNRREAAQAQQHRLRPPQGRRAHWRPQALRISDWIGLYPPLIPA